MNLYGKTFADLYDRHFSDYASKATPYLLKWFSSQPVSQIQPSILDLGCGTGQLGLRFLEAGYTYTGLDHSPHMLQKAEEKCGRFKLEGKAQFLEADFSSFKISGPFGLVVSTYNSLNHLETPEKLWGCFGSARKSLGENGLFLFDYHTRAGLKDWASVETAEWDRDKVEIKGEFNEKRAGAVMKIKGTVNDQPFEEIISNRAFPLVEIEEWLYQEGFTQVTFSELVNLGTPLSKPEEEKRVVIIAA